MKSIIKTVVGGGRTETEKDNHNGEGKRTSKGGGGRRGGMDTGEKEAVLNERVWTGEGGFCANKDKGVTTGATYEVMEMSEAKVSEKRCGRKSERKRGKETGREKVM